MTKVVGLGDSFASGEGAMQYDPGTHTTQVNMCHRSPESWQRMVDVPGRTGETYTHKACSGATVANLLQTGQYREPAQITTLDTIPDESVVLLSIGGNDVGFTRIVVDCVVSSCMEPAQVSLLQAKIRDVAQYQIRPALDAVLARIPSTATVVLAGYPQLTQGSDCFGITLAESRELDRMALLLRRHTVGEVMKLRLAGKRVRYADTIDPFKGHGACGGTDRWINSASTTPPETFHPNDAGYLTYTTAVNRVLSVDVVRCTATGCRAKFADESVYYSPSGNVRAVSGAIRATYEVSGEETNFLGYPLTDEFAAAAGRTQRFGGGDIYLRTGTTTAYWSRGKILAKYKVTGEAGGPLGFPVSNEFVVPSGAGKRQNFQFGSVFYRNAATAAFWSTGPILDKYRVERYDEGKLGWPTTDHACGLQPGNACRQHFDGSGQSVVYYTPTTGAHKVIGAIRDFYASTGWQNSHPDPESSVTAGYPIGDEYISPYTGHYEQNFERGRIEYYQGFACWWALNTDFCTS